METKAEVWIPLTQGKVAVIEVEAAKAYDTAAIKYFEEYASPNFPKEVSNAA